MQISRYALEHMGYTEYPEDDILNVIFHCLKIFKIEGINVEDQIGLELFELGNNCYGVITNDLNKGCEILTNQNFTEDEEKWIKDKSTGKPFLLIFFKEDLITQLKGGYRQKYEEMIVTYAAFENELNRIKAWKKEILPKVITSLVLNFSKYNQSIIIKPIDEKIFGLTIDGTYLEDVNFTMTARATQYFNVSSDDVKAVLIKTEKEYQKIPENLAKNFTLALNEMDHLKQFLGFFQIIEKFTHLCFKKIDLERDLIGIINVASEVKAYGHSHFKNFFEQSTNLKSRFIWCALTIWKGIDDSDIAKFDEIKKIRDKLSHGEDVSIKNCNLWEIKLLTIKLLQQS